MFSQEEYYWGWLLYSFGALALFGCVFITTSKFRSFSTRLISRLFVLLFLLVPWPVSSDSSFLAPAWVAAALEALFDGKKAFVRAGMPLLTILVSFLIASLVVTLVFKIRSRKVSN